MIGLGKRMHSK